MGKTTETPPPDEKNLPSVQGATAVAFADDEFFGMDSGLEDVTSADLTLPRYTILQGLSPQVNSRKDEYIEGAQMGMIMNTATGKVMDSVQLVMAAYERRNIEWVPRDKPCPIAGFPQVTGGGLYRDYGTDDAILEDCKIYDENNSIWTPRGNELVVTGTWYVVDPDTLSSGFLAMGKTQFTSSKKLMAGIRDEKIVAQGQIRIAPLFYRIWELSTRLRKDDKNEWFVWQHKPSLRVQEHPHGRAILNMVKDIRDTIHAGSITIDVAAGETEGQASGGGGLALM